MTIQKAILGVDIGEGRMTSLSDGTNNFTLDEYQDSLNDINAKYKIVIDGLEGKADIEHSHEIADVDELQGILDNKASVRHVHEIDDVNGLLNTLESKANSNHAHEIANVNGLQTALDGKAATSLLSGYVPTGRTITASAPLTGGGALSSNLTLNISDATTSARGVMSAADKIKLNGIAAGAQVNTVTSVAGRTGSITLSAADVGLGNVNNTSDANKPISTATQAALNGKAPIASPTFSGNVNISGTGYAPATGPFKITNATNSTTFGPAGQIDIVVGGVTHTSGTIATTFTYTTTEQWTGDHWINGKKIYQTTVNCGAPPNATQKAIAHGIANVSSVLDCRGIAVGGGGLGFTLPWTESTSDFNSVGVHASDTYIWLTTQGGTLAAYASVCYITLRYICTDR